MECKTPLGGCAVTKEITGINTQKSDYYECMQDEITKRHYILQYINSRL